jgi:hypothetical protein
MGVGKALFSLIGDEPFLYTFKPEAKRKENGTYVPELAWE